MIPGPYLFEKLNVLSSCTCVVEVPVTLVTCASAADQHITQHAAARANLVIFLTPSIGLNGSQYSPLNFATPWILLAYW